MEKEEIKLKIQALADNELPEKEIPAVLDMVRGSYELRDEYIELLTLNKKMQKSSVRRPPEEWFESVSKKVSRKTWNFLGKLLFFGSYIMLFAYTLYTLFSDDSTALIIKLAVGGSVLGILVLLVITIADRLKENQTDKYKEVIR